MFIRQISKEVPLLFFTKIQLWSGSRNAFNSEVFRHPFHHPVGNAGIKNPLALALRARQFPITCDVHVRSDLELVLDEVADFPSQLVSPPGYSPSTEGL
jgi:hypothetical protein